MLDRSEPQRNNVVFHHLPLDPQSFGGVKLLVGRLQAKLLIGSLDANLLIALDPDGLFRLNVVDVLQLGGGRTRRRYARSGDDIPLADGKGRNRLHGLLFC